MAKNISSSVVIALALLIAGCPERGTLAIPGITDVVPQSPSGDSMPMILGTAVPGAVVALYLNGTCTGMAATSATADESGAFAITANLPLNAATELSLQAMDNAGNVSPCVDVGAYVHDSLAPGAPTGLVLSPGPFGASNDPTLSGVTEHGSVVSLFPNGDCNPAEALSTALADGAGAFLLAWHVANGSVTTIWLSMTDPAGNVSACFSTGLSYTQRP